MGAATKITIVDDDPSFCEELAGTLLHHGYSVSLKSSADSFIRTFDEDNSDVVLLDKNLGNQSGFDLIHFVRQHEQKNSTPIIIVTGDMTAECHKEAILTGADGILGKPLDIEDLKLKVLALMRRKSSFINSEQNLVFKNLVIQLNLHQVSLNGEHIPLTTTEYRFLVELISKKDTIISRTWLVNHILSHRNNNERTLDVHVNALRKKLGDYSSHIKTIRGRGYMFQSAI